MSDGEINYQCWICPKCSDDHCMDGPCSPPNIKPFSPSPDDNSYIAVKFRELESELAKYKQMYPIVHDKMKVCTEKFKEQQAELSRYREAVKVMRDALDVLKVAVNDKQPDPSAVNFISKTQREADRILKGDKG